MARASLESLLEQIIENKLLSGQLSSPRDKQEEGILKIAIRSIVLKNINMYQFSFHYKTKVIHQNKSPAETVALIRSNLENVYKQGIFSTQDFAFHVLVNKHREMTIIEKPSKGIKALPMHNRKKYYVLEEGKPVPFLIDLGVMTADGKVIAKKYDKFKQINRFLEMVRDIVDYLPKGRSLEIIDFGCGKAYLTFALYHYLHYVEGLKINLLGLDLKQEVIEHCQALANRLGYEHLNFSVGDINQHVAHGKVDMVITLHACDTATDAALEKAVQWGAEVILCVPCCQHELFSQVNNDALASLLRYGLLKERFAALATDAARA
ncbi:MAG: SAM-dependent methyltransferase, partial [Parachlamydiaceae bacterium]|nr:SAM-dependent methyltransferase [Parachlamydiaceae bacterium]